MARNLIQLRYYGDNDERNLPRELTKESLSTGEAFYNYLPIRQLGVQTIPGVKFYLNDSVFPIIMGNSGIYDLMSTGTLRIGKLDFDPSSLSRIEKNANNYLIIDILYGEGA